MEDIGRKKNYNIIENQIKKILILPAKFFQQLCKKIGTMGFLRDISGLTVQTLSRCMAHHKFESRNPQ